MSPSLTVFLLAFVATSGYAAGRLHQWYRTALERDAAWRDGYDQAAGTLFKLAAGRRKTAEPPAERGPAANATVTDIGEAPSAGRHSLEIRQAVTRRLPGRSSEKAV